MINWAARQITAYRLRSEEESKRDENVRHFKAEASKLSRGISMSLNWWLAGNAVLLAPTLVKNIDQPEQMNIFNDDQVKLDFKDVNIIDNKYVEASQNDLKHEAYSYIIDTCFPDGVKKVIEFPLNEV